MQDGAESLDACMPADLGKWRRYLPCLDPPGVRQVRQPQRPASGQRVPGGQGRRTERYHCSYGLNPAYLEALAAGGLRFSGFDDGGQVRIVELPGHPFFLGTLFQPELSGDGTQPHPVIRAFAAAAAERVSRLASSS